MKYNKIIEVKKKENLYSELMKPKKMKKSCNYELLNCF